MNIDDFKDAWKNDDQSKHASFYDIVKGKTSSPVDKVRRNMRGEFVATIFSYVAMFWFLFENKHSPLYFNLICIVLFVLLLLNTYYFLRFYIFYRSMAKFDASLKESIEKITFDLQLNIELYRAYNLCATPLVIIFASALFCGKWVAPFLVTALNTTHATVNFMYILATLLVSFIVTYLITEAHLRRTYAKPLKELKSILHELNQAEP